MAFAVKTAGKQRGRPFPKGVAQNPTGRPKGARNKLSEDFFRAFAEDFEKHGPTTIAVVRAEDPATYLKIAGTLVPKDLNLNHDSTELFAKVWKAAAGVVDDGA